uniref:cell division protein SepF n=1 Tax=Agathobacter sp. TaxID=2021311 RepID=UPI004055CF2B
MSIMDKFLDAMRLNDEDEYEFDNEEYWEEEDDYVEEKPKKASRKEQKKDMRKEIKEVPKEKPASNSKITPINKSQRKQATISNMEVCVIKPTTIEDEIEITDTLMNGRTVVINMEGLNLETAQRIIDFTCGSTYAMQGNLQKISNYIFLATPKGVDISGDIQNLMEAFGDGSATGFTF